MAQRGSRKRRKRRSRAPREQGGGAAHGYARGREKDEAARAALRPLPEGERPPAVTVGAVVAAVAAIANLVALAIAYDSDEGRKTTATVLGTVILVVVAVGMWRARYWAVLGMQTLLAITMILGSLALVTAVSVPAGALAIAIVAASGTLFWFLIKAMARIQMPERPGRTG